VRILVLTFYFHPDLSAGSYRATAFVSALREALVPNSKIDVITTLPNRYKSFSANAPDEENDGMVTIRRIPIPLHQSGMLDQASAFRSYAFQVLKLIRGKQYDLVYATSSRMFTGFLGAICSKRLGVPLYLDIRDIFNDTIKDVLKGNLIKLLMPVLRAIERYTIGAAKRVNVVSEGFLPYFQSLYPRQSFSFFPNGVDDEFIGVDFMKPPANSNLPRRVLYAGNIGQGQGLHRIIPSLALAAAEDGYVFDIVGDGGARGELEKKIADSRITNIRILDPVCREELIDLYRNADVLFMHLNDLDAFHNVLPSKLFEYAATGKPILAGVTGYAAKFISSYISNAEVFPPCDSTAGYTALHKLKIDMTDRTDFINRFSRENITRGLVKDVLQVIGQ